MFLNRGGTGIPVQSIGGVPRAASQRLTCENGREPVKGAAVLVLDSGEGWLVRICRWSGLASRSPNGLRRPAPQQERPRARCRAGPGPGRPAPASRSGGGRSATPAGTVSDGVQQQHALPGPEPQVAGGGAGGRDRRQVRAKMLRQRLRQGDARRDRERQAVGVARGRVGVLAEDHDAGRVRLGQLAARRKAAPAGGSQGRGSAPSAGGDGGPARRRRTAAPTSRPARQGRRSSGRRR